jgi:hypothetical protein
MNTVMGFTEQDIANFGLTFVMTAFMLYMVFIVVQLARESKAGVLGTVVLFLVLTMGMVGFAAKYVIKWQMDIG